MKKIQKFVLALVIPIALVFFMPVINAAYLWGYKQIVNMIYVTDPNDPRFDIKDFSFSKYATSDDLSLAVKALFPPGTEKSYVEDILVRQAGAKAEDFATFVLYDHETTGFWETFTWWECPFRGQWQVKIDYNSNHEVERVMLRGPC